MMKFWKVRLSRTTTESLDLIVEAESAEAANNKALEHAGKYGENLSGLWVPDEGNQAEVYLPDAVSTTKI